MSKQIKMQVERTLNIYPDTRNSDALLILNLYRQFYYLPEPVSQQKLLEIMRYAEPWMIVRYRQKFNQEGKYLATSPTVLEERTKRIKKVKEELGYNVGKMPYKDEAELDQRLDQVLKLNI